MRYVSVGCDKLNTSYALRARAYTRSSSSAPEKGEKDPMSPPTTRKFPVEGMFDEKAALPSPTPSMYADIAPAPKVTAT